MSKKQKPGVADNKSYKDQYHFNDNFYHRNDIKDVPSLNVDPKINDSIKENPYRSNVEIEKDELILKPDLSALFKARGKTHKQGGIDVLLEEDSFVFSDDPTLSFSEDDHELFEFKKGGTFNKKKNTPADVLKRNLDVKHYNTLISNITDIDKDDLAKRSSIMMLEKYIETLGNVAYLQEEKKNFPDGIPSFSMGTAPVYNADVKNEVMEQKQYAKYGGRILPKAQMGRIWGAKETKEQRLERLRMMASRQALNGVGADEPDYDKQYMDLLQELSRAALHEGDQQASPVSGPLPANPYTPKQGKYSGVAPLTPVTTPVTPAEIKKPLGVTGPNCPCGKLPDGQCAPCTPDIITPGSVSGEAGVKNIDWQFSPWQRISQGYNLGKLATAKRYMPMRSRLNPTYVDPSLVNPEQAVGDLQAAGAQSLRALGSLNPILRNAQASGITGNILDKLPGVRSAYDNQNAGIINQTRSFNAQTANQTRGINMKNDQDYYQQTITGQANFDNMKNFLGDQYMNNLMQDVQDNQSLAYQLATLDNPAWGYNFRSGNLYRNPKDIRDVRSTGSQEDLLTLATRLKDQGWSDKLIGDLMRSKAFQSARMKKGGSVKSNPYK